MADGLLLQVTEMTCSVHVVLDTKFGPVALGLFASAVMSGKDDVLILGWPTLEILGLGIYAGLTECAKPMEGVNFIACPYMSLSVEGM